MPVAYEPCERDAALRTRQMTGRVSRSAPHNEASAQLHHHIGDDIAMAKRIVCECGYVIEGEDDAQVVERGREHMRANHPAIAAVITAEELLELAEEE